MPQALCAIDERPGSAQAVSAAMDFCRRRGAGLTLVGVIRPMRAVTQPAHGELVRRLGDVELRLIQAARAAREQGLEVGIIFRAGDPATELVRHARAVGAEDIFVANGRSALTAALKRGPRAWVTHLTVPARAAESEAELRAVA